MSDNNEEPLSIDSLAVELVLNIFKFLNTEDLKVSALVCKKWSTIIGESSVVMKKLPLSLEGSWLRLHQISKDFRRKYHTIKLENICEWNKSAEKVLSQHCFDLRELELDDCLLPPKDRIFENFFSSLTKLEMFKCINVDLDESKKAVNPHNLPNLKSVVLYDSNWEILNFIKSTQLVSLKISGIEETADPKAYLIDYLSKQTRLEELALRNFRDYDCAEYNTPIDADKLSSIQFPLKMLAIDTQDYDDMLQSEENTIRFLKKFDHLEHLQIGKRFPDSVYELIFKTFLKLKTLIVNINHAPSEDSFYQNLRPNGSVKKIFVRGYSSRYLKALQGFIGNLPNIETLVMVDDVLSNELMLFISNNLKLKNLQVHRLQPKVFLGVSMTSLKSVSIDNLESISMKPSDWKLMVTAFKNIEELTIGSTDDEELLSDLNFNIFTKSWPHLRHVRLGHRFVAKKRVFNQLLKNCMELKTVEIFEDAFDSPKSKMDAVLRDFKRDGLRFIVHPKNETWECEADRENIWRNEKFMLAEDESDSDDDSDDDIGVYVRRSGNEILLAMLGGGIPHGIKDESDYDNQFIYFDSDGEMRDWFEEPDLDDDYFDLD